MRLGLLLLHLLAGPVDPVGERGELGGVLVADLVDLPVAPLLHPLSDPHAEVALALVRPRDGADRRSRPAGELRGAAQVALERCGERRVATWVGKRRGQRRERTGAGSGLERRRLGELLGGFPGRLAQRIAGWGEADDFAVDLNPGGRLGVADACPADDRRLIADRRLQRHGLLRSQEHFANTRRENRPRAAVMPRGRRGRWHRGRRGSGRVGGRCRTGRSEPLDLVAEERATEIGHRPTGLKERLLVAVHAVHQEPALFEPREHPVEPAAVERTARGLCGSFESVEDAGLVAGGLQPAEEPEARVGEALVVEIDGVLRGQHHAEAVGAGLFHEREDRRLARRVGGGRQVAEYLVHQEQGPQRRRAPLRSHPRDRGAGQQRDERHPLGVGEVGDRDDRHAGFPFGRPQKSAQVERFAIDPGVKSGCCGHRVEPAGEGEPVTGREEVFQVEEPDSLDGRGRHGPHERAEINFLATLPQGVEDRGEEHVLAASARLAVDADQREDRRDE